MKQFITDSLDIIKLRISLMQVITVVWGYWLAHPNPTWTITVTWLSMGTFVVSAGVGMLNHYLERQTDQQMVRTQNRPLPGGRFNPTWVFILGLCVTMVGVGILFRNVNGVAGFISMITAGLYLLVYTPLKRVSWLNTLVGAFPGGLPPVGGWATGALTAGVYPLGLGAWLVLAIFIAWQHPHFYAIGYLYKDDYKRAGIHILPNSDATGSRMRRHMFISVGVLTLATVWLYRLDVLSIVGLSIGLVLSAYYLKQSLDMVRTLTNTTAKALLKGSILYLVLFMLGSVL